jgi:putative DNA primase/helicase
LKAAIIAGESYHVPATRLIGKWAQQGVSLLETQRRIESIFDEVPEAERDERWRMRYADLGRVVLDIYGKEAGKEGFGERPRAAGREEARCLRPISAEDFLALDIPPRGLILEPWLPTQGLAMIYSFRGVGKTLLGLTIAYAVASGETFFGWSAPQPRRVLYLDGEMPAATMQDRLRAIIAGFDCKPPSPNYLQLLSADITDGGLPDLASARGQAEVDAVVGEVELIVADNLSTLVRSGKENEGESWLPIQGWALAHRRAGRSILVIHHAGKGGQQRGTSRREDVLDTVIKLSHPVDYGPDQGARFEVHFDKARGLFGDKVRPFEARYDERDGAAVWTRTEIADHDLARVVEALSDGLSIRKAGDALGLDKSKVQRLKNKAVKQGLIDG